jgi:adenosylcobinamide-GDP ribazoletransferase
MSAFLTAWHFLTVIPLPWKGRGRVEDLSSSLAYYPFVGLFLGGCLVAGLYLFSFFLPKSAAALLTLLLLAVLSGGIHLDGFADTLDGLFGGRTREERLAIMRDGRIGSMAALGLFFLMMGKLLLLEHLAGREQLLGVLVMPVAGRWAMVLGAYLAPYARQEGLGKEIIGKVSDTDCAIASVSSILIVLVALRWRGMAILFLIALGVVAAVRYFTRRLGGMTGDTVGAVGELTELFFLMLLVGIPRGV